MPSAVGRVEERTIAKKRVLLLVEDEVLIRSAVAEYLRDIGFIIIEAADATEAMAALAAGTEVDIVFSDVMMPGPVDGLGLAAWIKERHADLPVLLTSGVRSARQGEFIDRHFVSKPYVLRELERRLQEILDSGC